MTVQGVNDSLGVSDGFNKVDWLVEIDDEVL